jgi:hypothetical protein
MPRIAGQALNYLLLSWLHYCDGQDATKLPQPGQDRDASSCSHYRHDSRRRSPTEVVAAREPAMAAIGVRAEAGASLSAAPNHGSRQPDPRAA